MTRDEFSEQFGSETAACEKIGVYLACIAFDHGSTKYELELEDITEKGVEKGSWTITVKRTDI